MQMSERAGFDIFLDKLISLNLEFTVEGVPEAVYEIAQKIQIDPLPYRGNISPKETRAVQVTTQGGSSNVTSSITTITQSYYFPGDIICNVNEVISTIAIDSGDDDINDAVDHGNDRDTDIDTDKLVTPEVDSTPPDVVWRWGGNGRSGKFGARNNLVKTDIESFVVLRIKNTLPDNFL